MKSRLKGCDGRFIPTGNDKFHKGYKVLYMPSHPHSRDNGYVYEHILVAEKKIGRSLLPEEVVHHIDGDKLNNNPNNLMVFANNVEHMKHHWKSKRNKYVLNNGETVNLDQISKMAGISYMAAYQRIKKLGWTADEVIIGHKCKPTKENANAAT